MSFPTPMGLFFSAPIPQVQEHPNTDGVVEKFLPVDASLHALVGAVDVDVGAGVTKNLDLGGVLQAVTVAASVDLTMEHALAGTLQAVASAGSVTFGSHQYWRFDFADANGDPDPLICLYGIALTVGGTEVSDNTMTAAADTTWPYPASDPSHTFDVQYPLRPQVAFGWAPTTVPAWWSLDLGAGNPQAVDGFILKPQTVARSPGHFTISYSDNNSTWTVAGTYTATTGWTAATNRAFTIP